MLAPLNPYGSRSNASSAAFGVFVISALAPSRY